MTEREIELSALPDLLSVADAAKALRVSVRTISNLVRRGDLKKAGRGTITKESLIVAVAGRDPVTPAPAPAQHDVPVDVAINEVYEDLHSTELRAPSEHLDADGDAFKKQCAYYDSLLPSIGQLKHPAPFDFERYFDAPKD